MAGGGDSDVSRRFPRTVDSLPKIFEFIEAFFAQAAIPADHLHAVQFAVEELFTNQVKYQTGGSPIEVGLGRNGDDLTVRITDFGVEPFDIRAVPDAAVDAPLEKRRAGGLGIHLLKRMVDDVDYEFVDGRSTTTLTKSLR